MEILAGGDTKQFTLMMSVSPDDNPNLSIFNSSNTAVTSLTSAQSGAITYQYYSFYTLPTSPGIYYSEWNISVNSRAYIERSLFEIILVDADQAGLYSNPNNLRAIYPKIDTTGLSNMQLNQYISDVDAIINMRLSARYSVPFATGVNSLPPAIGYLSKNLALLEILSRPSIKAGGDTPGWIEDKQDYLNNLLKGLETGSYSLVVNSGGAIGAKASGVIWSDKSDYHPIFSLLDAEQQVVDPDYIDELEGEL
jgi:hypothetical protein